ncbi:hypothetical protein IAD21_00081 [Abditibacteriota bacterium]|nr:hypothetical protein IAD21_00081 [Abditibacteriota bacterium]
MAFSKPMTSFIVRVELQGGHDEDYRRLDAEMEKRKFLRAIPDANGQSYVMPSGEYFYQGHKSAAYMCEMGEQAATVIGKTSNVLAAEVMMVAFSLEPVKGSRRSYGPFD